MVLVEDLRQAVLQAALQGKLTEQLETDSDVDEMLRHIAMYREEIKECKNTLNLEAMDIEIPDSWRMIELNSILSFVDYRGKTPNKIEKGIFFITASNIKKGYMDYTRKEYISEEEYRMRQSRGTTNRGDLLFTTEAPLGNAAICDLDITSCGQRIITMKAYCENTVCLELFMYFILSSAFQNELLDNCTGTTAKGIKADKLKHLLIPLPPIEEQHRIVDKINEIMSKIDEYEKNEKELEAIRKEFPTNMKDALLQAAMQGKLTEQLEGDSSVDELLLCIEKDRINKINSGLVKKDKRLFIDYIDDEDVSYIIPDTWRMVMLGSIVYKLTDGTHKTPKYTIEGVKFVSVKDMSSGKLDLSNTKFITQAEHNELYKRCNPEKGDMLLSKVGTTGVPAIIDTDEQFSLFVSVALLKYNHRFINEKFLYYLLMSPLVQEQVKENTRGIGNKNWVLDFIAKTVIVLPPLEEQQRIVERLDALLPLCENLKE